MELLNKIHIRLSEEIHPDLFFNSPKFIKNNYEKALALVNKAFYTLKNPFNRAKYLLNLKHKELSWNEKILPTEFLNEMFIIQEKLEDDRKKNDYNQINNTKQKIIAKIKNIEKKIYRDFAHSEKNFRKDNLQNIQKNLNIYNYLSNIINRI